MSSAKDVDRLQPDYERTMQQLRALMEVRFKLLAFVPTISGAAVALFGRPRPAVELLVIGVLGLVATLGVFMYELRNSQLYGAALQRAEALERRLGLPSALGGGGPGGLVLERPSRNVRLFGLFAVGHERGLALVYAAAIAGWSYLVAWGALNAFDVDAARNKGVFIAAVVGLLLVAEVERIDRRLRRARARPTEAAGAPSHAPGPG